MKSYFLQIWHKLSSLVIEQIQRGCDIEFLKSVFLGRPTIYKAELN